MRRAIGNNQILHVLVMGFSHGDPVLELDVCHKRFFLDPNTFRIIDALQAPVLPCFALCDDRGRLLIRIYASLPPVTETIIKIFGPLYAGYIKEMPEFGYFWKRMAEQRGSW